MILKTGIGSVESRSYGEIVTLVDSLIREADRYMRTDAARLQEVAARIDTQAQAIGYRRGTGYAEFFKACVLYLRSEFESALPGFTTAHDIFNDVQDTEGTCLSLRYLGLSHHLLCRYAWALEYYRQELETRERSFSLDTIGTAGTITNIATMYWMMGQYDTALKHYLEAIRVMGDNQDNRVYLATVSNISDVYMALEEYAQALEQQAHVLELYRQKNDRVGEAHILLGMGCAYDHCGEYAQALDCSNRALHLFELQENRQQGAIAKLYIGQTYLHMEQFEEAMVLLVESYAISYEIGDKKNCADVLLTRGDLAATTRQYEEARACYLDALDIANEIGIRQLEYCLYELLSKLEERTGNAIAALDYYRNYIRVKEEVMDERRRQAVSEMQVRFDVEQTKKQKEIYRLKNVELVGALQKVETLNHELIEVSNEKNDLMGIVAHDLKNPISGLGLSLSMLKSYILRMSPQDIIHQIDLMDSTVLRMEHIVGKLLEVNALDSGKMIFHFEAFDFNEAVHAVVTDYEIRMNEKHITMQCVLTPIPVEVYADKEATLEVLDNLVSNAIKYSPHHTGITVKTSVVGAMARFEVLDSGPGISAADQDKLFKKFTRLDARPTGGESSTGLGLSIVKKLVESMDGRVWCESTLGESATFFVELPINNS